MSAWTSTALDTSVLTKIASPPCSVIMWTVWCPPSSCISAMISLAPSLAKANAVALPIPDAPPVTNATFPSTRPGMLFPPADDVHWWILWTVVSCFDDERNRRVQDCGTDDEEQSGVARSVRGSLTRDMVQ